MSVAAAIVETYQDRGCERSAYPPIVASGPNAIVLHYTKNRRRMEAGELLLMDAGAECAAYAADITRTIPLGGRFTARQREIYDIVLGAEKAAIAAVRPGTTIAALTKAGLEYVNTHGKDRQGAPLGQYYIHGISHHVGLEVHGNLLFKKNRGTRRHPPIESYCTFTARSLYVSVIPVALSKVVPGLKVWVLSVATST